MYMNKIVKLSKTELYDLISCWNLNYRNVDHQIYYSLFDYYLDNDEELIRCLKLMYSKNTNKLVIESLTKYLYSFYTVREYENKLHEEYIFIHQAERQSYSRGCISMIAEINKKSSFQTFFEKMNEEFKIIKE